MITSAIGGSTSLQALQGAAAPPGASEAQPAGDGFEGILKSLGINAFEDLRKGEATGIAAIEGKASAQQAVMATMQAEQSLQAALAIRDKIVSAFLEISRMQI